MNLDMSINGGGIGGSSGLLDWGSDIARMKYRNADRG